MPLSSDRTRRWVRIGQVVPGPGDVAWAQTHAAIPFAEVGSNDRLSVHFCARDRQSCARIGRVEIDLNDWTIARPVSEQPVLDVGRPGTFDDHGVTSSWIVAHQGRRYHYYTGWSLGRSVPFYFFVGLAVSEDDADRPTRVSSAPILERSDIDPYLTASPCVLVDDGVWRMWYVSGVGWRLTPDASQPEYHIKYAESRDGIVWQRHGVVCIDFSGSAEHAIARPCVIKDTDRYRMWFCCRGAAYRIGYAESRDGIAWDRDDAAGGLQPAPEGWDSEMAAYPFVFDHQGHRYLLYNGNGYGKSGFGAAVWK
jgi:hypothetical protein